MKHNYCVYKTLNNYYLYDAGCNKFIRISKNLYENIQKKGISGVENLVEFQLLKEMGFFINEIKLKKHPVTDVLPYMIDRQMQVMVLQITQGCNLRCRYCPYSQTNNLTRIHSSKMMTWEMAKKSIDFLCDHSVDSQYVTLNFYGGEPLLNFDLIKKSVSYIKKQLFGKNLNFGITTNATLLTEEIMHFLDENNFALVISLDGDKPSNDKNRKFAVDESLSVFSVVMDKLSIIKDRFDSLFKNLSLNMVLDPSVDYCEYENLLIKYPFLKKINIDIVIKNDSYSEIKNVWSDCFTEKYYYKLFLGYLRSVFGFYFKEELKFFAGVSTTFDRDVFNLQAYSNNLYANGNVTPSGMCLIGHDKVFVTATGDFYPCERVNETDEMIKLGDIENGFDIEKVRKVLNYKEFFKDRCQSCIAVRECDMCLNNFGSSGVKNDDSSMSICEFNRKEFIEKLKKRSTLYEVRQVLNKLEYGGIDDGK